MSADNLRSCREDRAPLAVVCRRHLLPVALLLLAGAAAYANSLDVPFVLDDHYSIDFLGKGNMLELMLHGSSRRVADITFAINYRLHGLGVAGYHLFNLTIHILSSIVLYFIAVSSVSAVRTSFAAGEQTAENTTLTDRFLPIAAALFFVVHPVQTQAVTYIIQRYASLSTFFYLLSMLFYIRARLAIERDAGYRLSSVLFGMTLAAGLLALFSKQIAVTIPLMLLFIEMFLFRGRLINRRFFMATGILVLLAVVAVLIKFHESRLEYLLIDLHQATTEDQFTSRTTYFLTQTGVVATYLRLLCLPYGQSLIHDSPVYKSLFAAPVISFIALHISLIAVAVLLFRNSRKNLSSGKWTCGLFQRLASLGICWFYIAMMIESSIFPIRDVIFEHRIYLPSAGFFLAVTAVFALILQKMHTGSRVAFVLLAAVCIFLCGLTIARNQVWRDPLTLWQDAAEKAPNKWLAIANLAGEYHSHRMPEKALPLFVRAIELNPNIFHMTKIFMGDSLKALGVYENRFTTGQEYVKPGGIYGSGTLDYNDMPKWDSTISNNMGLAYEYLKEPEKARKAYRFSVSLNPSYDLAWFNLALLSYRAGDRPTAYDALKKLQSLNKPMADTLSMILVAEILR